uniref:Protocadherin-20 n=1 Tax=Capitella teleta TaxID=283909 RepID=X2APU3_CAPTE
MSLVAALVVIVTHAQDDVGAVTSYTMAEGLTSGVTLGNIMIGTGLLSMYEQKTLQTLQFDILPGPYKKYYVISRTNWGRVDLMTSEIPFDRDVECLGQIECVVALEVAIVQPMDKFKVFPIEVTVNDNNDNAPWFDPDVLEINVSETAIPGPQTQFVIPSAQDPDSGSYGVQDYRFNTDSDKFDLEVRNNTDGSFDLRLTLIKGLDRETQASYSMVVTAYDGGDRGQKKSGTLQIKVNVVDANDNSPVFDQEVYESSVSEDVPSGTTITRVHATDLDIDRNGQIVYSLSSQTLTKYPDAFGVNNATGDIYVFTALDYETIDSYNLVVTARDLGPSSVASHTKVIIKVIDVNDHAPEITINSLTGAEHPQVMENALPGVFVAQMNVQDRDKGVSGQTMCDVDPASAADFEIQHLYKSMYKILTKRSFDREVSPEYNLSIQCSDKGDPQLTAGVTYKVLILDANDNAPQFLKLNYSRSLRENNTINMPILRVNATDRDEGKNAQITYSLSSNARDFLAIDPQSGVIATRAVFDFEEMKTFQFQVVATDHGDVSEFSTTNVLLKITDINDEAPLFHEPGYNFGTFENQSNGTEIGTVSASDMDEPPFNSFTYSLDESQGDIDVFEINKITGRITTKRVLDREHQSAYYLVVMATDNAYPHPSSSASVTIYVADRNDNAPMILHPNHDNHTVQLSVFSPFGHTFYKIVARDADLGNNARLTFSFGKGNFEEAFDIDPTTGVISVKGDLQEINADLYHVLIVVKDGGSPAKTAVASLNIVINHSEEFARETLNTLPQFREEASDEDKLGYHQKIIIILGCVTSVLVAILITAILCIRRKQNRQEKESYKYLCRLDTAQRMNHIHSGHDVTLDGQGTLPPPYSTAVAGDLSTFDGINIHDVSASTSDASEARLTNEVMMSPSRYAPCRSASNDHLHEPWLPRGHQLHLQQSSPVLPPHLSNQQVEVHKLLDILKTDDAHDSDSTSGCSADMSNSDSGRGHSEEGAEAGHPPSRSAPRPAPRLPRPNADGASPKHHSPSEQHIPLVSSLKKPKTDCVRITPNTTNTIRVMSPTRHKLVTFATTSPERQPRSPSSRPNAILDDLDMKSVEV